ncbi:glycosyl hydrolase family 61-domain-containing protein [Desarmillaria ectypa]|nr:glycosyl hydrolase family 61-domain-containing protein [Desarmillaria ectypa]
MSLFSRSEIAIFLVRIPPKPLRVVRGTKLDSGYIADVTSNDITCSIGNSALPPGPISANITAGQVLRVTWNTWPLGHYGPVLNYMAKCDKDNCSTFKGDTGSPSNRASLRPEWASDTLAKNSYTYDVTVPKNAKSGSYLLRHENLTLHGSASLGGVQFYPVCIQLAVSGGGSLAPSGLSFPGTYMATDPGILFNVYLGDASNEAHGPTWWRCLPRPHSFRTLSGVFTVTPHYDGSKGRG